MLHPTLKKTLAFLLFLSIGLPLPVGFGGDSPGPQDCLRLTGEIKIQEFFHTLLEEKRPGTLDLENGVTALITPWPNDHEQVARLVVRDGNKDVVSFRKYQFTNCFLLEAGPVRHWIIEDWNGAAHGGCQHRYFCRAAAGEPLRFLGTIWVGDHRTDETFGPGQIRCHNSQPFVRYDDNRFAYFETSFAESTALFFPSFYRLTPQCLVLDNRAFPEEYRQEIVKIDAEVKKNATQMQLKPKKISLGDDLGVWLVARTIHYLVLREEKRAWKSLEQDVAKYYQTKQGLAALKAKIRQRLAKSPY